jgi:predicted nucleic acid-binding protein
VLPFEIPADAEYGGIRSELEAAGKPIGGNDLLIAAHASATGARIVTANTRIQTHPRPEGEELACLRRLANEPI